MKKIIISLGLLIGCLPVTQAAKLNSQTPSIQSVQTEIKNAQKAMFSLISYNEKGKILHSGYGFFIDENGTGIAAFSLLEGASKAEIIDYKGNQLAVSRILGASSAYDLVKFSTEGAKKIEAFNISSNVIMKEGNAVSLVTYTGKKKAEPKTIEIDKIDDFEAYKYYQISAENVEKNLGCPLLDEEGNVIAIVQKNVGEKAEKACAIDARFVNELKLNSTSLLNADLNAINIPKGLPDTEQEALTYLYMLGSKDSIASISALNDFIAAYPDNAEGYSQRGSFYANHQNYAKCEEDFTTALEKAGNKQSSIQPDEIYNNLSKLIYNKVLYTPQPEYENWTLDRAIEEAGKAYAINPSPFYLLQQAHCYFGKKDYQKAYENYCKISAETANDSQKWSAQAKAETWLFASRAYEMNMKTNQAATLQDSLHLITLLDSAINALPKPYTPKEAPLFLERAQRYELVNKFRQAVFDYNEYEKIIGPRNLNDKFYYLREQAEFKGRMYQQALNDIRTAMAFNPKDALYPVEEAVILLRAGMFKEAVTACEKSLSILPENPDCYKIMGIAYGELKNKTKAQTYLQKAKELGDPTVDEFIEKYK